MSGERILVIATTGLDRFIPALGSMAALRAHHHGATIILLTTAVIAAFAASSPYFSDVWVDETARSHDLRHWWVLRRRLREQPFDRVYDFDASAHSKSLFWLMYGRRGFFDRRSIPWSGAIPGTALDHGDPHHASMHLVDGWTAQLRTADVRGVLRTDLSWVARSVRAFTVPFRMEEAFVLLCVETGPGAPWPAENYADLARMLDSEGKQPVLVSFKAEPEIVAAVLAQCSTAVDLTDKISVNDLIFLTWAATAAVGHDNGIMHLTAAAGCPTVVLFDRASDPALVAPRGDVVTVLRRDQLANIPVNEVAASLRRGRSTPKRSPRLPLA
jgi:ADP-heptose:LPS heptosyltransferase